MQAVKIRQVGPSSISRNSDGFISDASTGITIFGWRTLTIHMVAICQRSAFKQLEFTEKVRKEQLFLEMPILIVKINSELDEKALSMPGEQSRLEPSSDDLNLNSLIKLTLKMSSSNHFSALSI